MHLEKVSHLNRASFPALLHVFAAIHARVLAIVQISQTLCATHQPDAAVPQNKRDQHARHDGAAEAGAPAVLADRERLRSSSRSSRILEPNKWANEHRLLWVKLRQWTTECKQARVRIRASAHRSVLVEVRSSRSQSAPAVDFHVCIWRPVVIQQGGKTVAVVD